MKKETKKYQTIVKEKTPLLKINTRRDKNALKIELKQRVNEQVVKIEKQLQQLEQEKENLIKEKKKWWKNIWTTVISFGRRNRKNKIQEQLYELEERIKNEKIAVGVLKDLLKKDIVNSISNLNTKLKIENLTNENKRLKTELINAKIKIFSSKVLLEKNKVELSEKLTKVDKTDKINTNLKDTVLSIVSDDKNIGVLTSVGNIVIDYILKPKKETRANDILPLQIN